MGPGVRSAHAPSRGRVHRRDHLHAARPADGAAMSRRCGARSCWRRSPACTRSPGRADRLGPDPRLAPVVRTRCSRSAVSSPMPWRRPEIDGAVVVQGTDVIEETAFAWDLLPLGAKPVVVVGAMRSASQEAYDGPENLRNAVAVAAAPEMAGQGVVVAMAGEIHGADDVRKTHTHAHATFRSPNAGPPRRRHRCARPRSPAGARPRGSHDMPEHAALPIPIVPVVLDEPPPTVPDDARAVVVAATGAGNTPLDAPRAGASADRAGRDGRPHNPVPVRPAIARLRVPRWQLGVVGGRSALLGHARCAEDARPPGAGLGADLAAERARRHPGDVRRGKRD